MSARYDPIIIGSGADGGTLAYRLAISGKRILLLERGGYVPCEKDKWSVFATSSAVNPRLTIMANALRTGDHLMERMDTQPKEMAHVG
jgi:choline dehydrogenase-like flavoprotein